MTITNHLQRIGDLAAQALVFIDAREFANAHSALDDIESRVHSARVHLDHLQKVLSQPFVSEDDSGIDSAEHLKWLQSQGGISSEGFGS